MRLFKSNKSQASLDPVVPHSREGSPTHPEESVYPPSQPYDSTQPYPNSGPTNLLAPSYDNHTNYDPLQTHPAHLLTRSQSHRQSHGPDSFANRPSVNVIAPHSETDQPLPEDPEPYPITQFGQQRSVHVEKEHREHKKKSRSFFGFSSKEKEHILKASSQSQVARAASLLRRNPANQAPEQLPPGSEDQAVQYQHSQDSNRYSAYIQNQENAPEDLEQVSVYDEHPAKDIVGYYHQQRHQAEFDAPSTADHSHFSAQQGYDQQEYSDHNYEKTAPDDPDVYGPSSQQSQQSTPVAHDHQLRPPSQQSLGASSPSINLDPSDSRPSTGTNQSRFSVQSVAVQAAQHAMPRSEPQNGGLRQHMEQQRDPRAEDARQGQYANQQDPRSRMSQQAPEQGRGSPIPKNREDPRDMDHQTLLQRHEELQAKYSKVKRFYFEKEAQVTQLQNVVANQRLAMLRTSLDDAQYTTRFERLNGAIRDLAFSIRKDWTTVPPWLSSVCNIDAHKVGQKEMIAIGRAWLSRWVYDMIFYTHFHPALDIALSSTLKRIERNIRSVNHNTFATEDQNEDFTAKICNWRLVTIEGLQDQLANSHDRVDNFVSFATERLLDTLKTMLVDPPPPTLPSGARMIVELAAGILSNLPNESRDVYVEYYMPRTPISETHMKMEGGIPPLVQPGISALTEDPGDDEGDSDTEGKTSKESDAQAIENEIREASAKATAMRPGGQSDSATTASRGDSKSKKSGGLFGGLVNKKSAPPSAQSSVPTKDAGGDREMMMSNEGKIRFAVFMAVEVRGKGGKEGTIGNTVLYRAPCLGYN